MVRIFVHAPSLSLPRKRGRGRKSRLFTMRSNSETQLAIATPAYANAIRTRRFCLPFFSICVTRTSPISLVVCTCMPPQGCRS